MKKLMSAAVALAFLTGTVAIAQEPQKQEKAAKKSTKTTKQKTSKRKAEEPKAQ
jgi:hypothetical protein